MDDRNPYASPAADVAATQPASMAGTAGRLFRLSGIGIATFFGTVLAGGILMAMNFRALGEGRRVWPTLGISLIAMFAVLLLGFLVPEDVPGILFMLPQLVLITWLAKHYQGAAIAARIAVGSPMRSNWLAVGISLLVLVGLFLLIALGVVAAVVLGGVSLEELVAG